MFFQPTHYQPLSALFISCNKLHATIYDFARSVHLDARQNQSRNELKCGDFWRCFFNQRIINRQARYSFRATSCTLRFTIYDLRFTIYDLARSVHLDARQNPSRNELKCGDFGKYFFNQRIINRQARYSFRATSCTLRFYKKIQKLCVNHGKCPT